MFSDAVRYVKTAISSLGPQDEVEHRDIYGRPVEHGDEFFHPQKFRGIPVFDTASIMRHHGDLIAKLREHVDVGDHRFTPCGQPMFKALYLDVIERYVEFAHMVPASEDHHHNNTGGLIQHSIEASIESLRWAKDHKHEMTGIMDIDQEIKPITDYCAWLGGLLHDAGKLMIDVSIDAVEIIHPLTKRPIKIEDTIPSWHPQRESLTDWARAHNVSTYSVSFFRHRTHKRHNVDSAQILSPLLRGSAAQDYILSTSLHKEMYSELVRVLSGYNSSKDILSESVRMGDSLSVQRNIGIHYDVSRGYRTISTPTRIFRAMSIAVKDWDWNRPKAQGYVVGGDVYIRWSSSIDTIVKAATEHDLGIPTDLKNVLNIMDQNGFLALFDQESPEDRIVKFTPGNFLPEDIIDITNGKRTVQWMDLLRLRDRGLCFPPEIPTPKSIPGLFLLSNRNTMVIVNQEGISTLFKLDGPESEKEQPKLQAKDSSVKAPTKPSTEKQESQEPQTKLPVKQLKEQDEPQEPVAAPSKAPEKKAMPAKAAQNKPKAAEATAEKLANKPRQELVFKNGPTKDKGKAAASEQPEQNHSTTDTKFGGSDTLKSIIDKQCPYVRQGSKVKLIAADVCVQLGMPLKQVISLLDEQGEMEQNLNNPSIKTVKVSLFGNQHDAIALTGRASRHFTYEVSQSKPSSEEALTADSPSQADDAPVENILKRLLDADVMFYVEGRRALIRLDSASKRLSISDDEMITELGLLKALDVGQANALTKVCYVQDGNDEYACAKLTVSASRKFLVKAKQSETETVSVKDSQPSHDAPSINDSNTTNNKSSVKDEQAEHNELSITDVITANTVIIHNGAAYLDVQKATSGQSFSILALKKALVTHKAAYKEFGTDYKAVEEKIKRDGKQFIAIKLNDAYYQQFREQMKEPTQGELVIPEEPKQPEKCTYQHAPEEWRFYLTNSHPNSLLTYLYNQNALDLLSIEQDNVMISAIKLHKYKINRRLIKASVESRGGRMDDTSLVIAMSEFLKLSFDEVMYG